MDLTQLIREIDYQDTYTYEKRVDLMNKYAISTSQKFFNPIYELGKFISDRRSSHLCSDGRVLFDHGLHSNYSHSGNVASSFNSDFNIDKTENKSKTVNYFKPTNTIWLRVHDKGEPDETKKMKPFIIFDLTNRTVTVCHDSLHGARRITIDRDLYDKIDEWLVDFGYEKW